jgi:hypothetical protein
MCDGAGEASPNKATLGSRKGIEPSRDGALRRGAKRHQILRGRNEAADAPPRGARGRTAPSDV